MVDAVLKKLEEKMVFHYIVRYLVTHVGTKENRPDCLNAKSVLSLRTSAIV